jgi:hypothetical protein
MARINVLGKPIEYDVGVTYDANGRGTPKIVEPGKDDLSKETKSAVVLNASDETRGVNDPEKRNRYPVGAGYNEISLNDPDGNPVPLDATPNTGDRTNGTGKQFVESREDIDTLKNYSNSTVSSGRTLKTPGSIAPVLKKGKQTISQGEHDGNTLLKDGVSKIQDSYVSPILSNNRFTAAGARSVNSPVRVNPNHPSETMGNYRAFRESNDGRDIHDGHMANIGTLLTVRATSELASSTGYGQDGPDGIGASAAALLPGTAQIGLVKVDADDLRPIEAFKALLEDDTDPVNLDPNAANDHFINNTGSSSFGQMNNVLEPFSGLLPLGMIAASTALVIAMKLALKGLTVLLSSVTSAKAGTTKKDSQGRYLLGSYIHSSAPSGKFPPLPIPAKLLGITDTVHDFEDCVEKGIEQVFGEGLGTSFQRVLETPGYYAVLCRNIVRSATNVVIQVQNAVKGNPIQVAQNIIELVNIIRSSKVIAAINVMAKIGDTVLTQNEKPFQKEEIMGITKYSMVDAIDDNFRVGKGRMQGRLQSALANSTSPSAFLFPRETIAALTAYSHRFVGTVTPASLASVKSEVGLGTKPLGDTGRRIPAEKAREVEAQLEAEYVPFYFHDLRTNEIISFHAFLRAMTDDFTVDTESVKPYGRVDPVKIYKSTERKISLEFFVVATNKQDFDQMWWKINKLATLVYPQWSKGAVMENPDTGDKFIQPFSQVPTNSPLIRLRLGDLFKSNYSRFALARLFGLGQEDAFFDVKVEDSMIDKLVEFSHAVDNLDLEALRDLIVFIEPGVYPVKTSNGSLSEVSLGGKSKNFSSVNILSAETAKVAEREDDGSYVVQLTERIGEDAFIVVPTDQIRIERVSLAQVLNSRLSSTGGTSTDAATLDKINKFLNPAENTIVRSFEASGGKGLACMIDSLGFNWLDNIPWETEAYGSRAPKMCQVKLSISPIHDIAPGIDANGFNRAPIYNVGEIVNGVAGDAWDETGKGRAKFDELRQKLRKVLK